MSSSSLTPRAASARASATIDSRVRLRYSPRSVGMMQKAQV
jgi:hypothetical protein